MKKIILTLLIGLISLNIYAQKKEKTTYYFIRHAEKIRTDNTNKNPDLSEIGKKRAEHWRTVFENIVFDKIYSTDYNRTFKQPLQPQKTKI